MTTPPPVPTPSSSRAPTPRPAATVMVIRDTDEGLAVFLMRRHQAMEFAAGVMVFPGGGVDDRDRNADIDWHGPPPSWWAQRLGVDEDLALALVCAAARETFEECGVLFASPRREGTADPDGIISDASVFAEARTALADNTLAFGDFLRRENLVLRADLLRPWANWVTPVGEPRRYDTYFFAAAMPQGQRADGENTESDAAHWQTATSAIADFVAGDTFLLPPTWTQLDSLADKTVQEVLTQDRRIVTVEPRLSLGEDNWEIEFFDSNRYNAARARRKP